MATLRWPGDVRNYSSMRTVLTYDRRDLVTPNTTLQPALLLPALTRPAIRGVLLLNGHSEVFGDVDVVPITN